MAAIRLSAKAHQFAHRPARREGRTVADIVERALEAYEIREASREPALAFYTRLARYYGCDVELEAVIRASRTAREDLNLIAAKPSRLCNDRS
jgi:hypothetical protein